MPSLYNTRDIANMFNVTVNSVLNWIYSGKLRAQLITGRRYSITQQDLNAFAILHRQTPLPASEESFSPRLMLVEVGTTFFNKVRHTTLSRWPNAKVAHAHTLFDACYFFECLHPDYIIIHSTSTPADLIAHCRQVTAGQDSNSPLLITLTRSEASIDTCIRQIERDAVVRFSMHIARHEIRPQA